MTTTALAAPPSPFKGLASFGDSEVDALFFFGRERESEVIAANVIASRLTILYGPSGVGKSSILRAGAARRLRTLAPEAAVVVHDAWAGNPVASLRDAVARAAPDLAPPPAAASLADGFADWTRRRGTELYLLLDQFEELFTYHRDGGRLTDELAGVVRRRGLPVNVLLAVREDALAELDVFAGRITNVFGNGVPLDRLSRDEARGAILGPVHRYNELASDGIGVEVEPELVELVLDEVAAGRVELGAGGQGQGVAPSPEAVEAPYLQLVMERLWEAELARGSHVLRRETLRELGGAEAVVRAHLERAVGALAPPERDVAARIFNHLVTPSGTKIAHGVEDLAGYAHVAPEELRRVLSVLGDERIVRPLEGRYEIFHDVLAGAVVGWRQRFEAERALERERRRHRRTLVVAALALVGLALMTAVAAYAFTQRSEAREKARLAQARELAARASVALDVDPQESLALAVEAAELEGTPEVEEVLRRGLLTGTLRRTWRLGGRPRGLVFTAGGRLVAVSEGDVLAFLAPATGRVARRVTMDTPIVALAAGTRGLWVVTETSAWRADAATGRVEPVLPAGAPPAAAAIAARADAVAVGVGETVLVAAGERRTSIPVDGRVQRVALSADGRTLAAVARARSGRVQTRLYDISGRRRIALLPQIGVRDVEFAPSGALVATASADGSTMLWAARSGRLLGVLDDGGGSVGDIAFDERGELLATGSSDGGARVWEVRTRERRFFFVGHTGAVTRVAFAPDAALLATASADRTARFWFTGGIEQGRLAARLVAHTAAVTTLAFAPDGRTLLTAADDGTARSWNAQIEQRARILLDERSPVIGARFAADGRGVLAVTAEGAVVAGSVDGARTEMGGAGAARVAALASGADAAIVGGAAGVATAWDGAALHRLDHGAAVDAVAASRDGRVLATADATGVTRVWSAGGKRLAILRQQAAVTAVEAAPDGRRIATGDADGTVRVWDVRSERVLVTLRGHRGRVVAIAFSGDGAKLATAGVDGTARLSTASGRLIRVLRGHERPLTDVVFDPTGSRLVTTSTGSSQNAILWSGDGRLLHLLVGHFGTVSGADFSADGRWIATAGPLATVLWRASTGHRLDFVRGHGDLLTSVAFARRGHRIVTAARDGTVGFYTCTLCVGVDGLTRMARQRLARAAG